MTGPQASEEATVALSGTASEGETWQVTLNGVDHGYLVANGDSLTIIASALADDINSNAADGVKRRGSGMCS